MLRSDDAMQQALMPFMNTLSQKLRSWWVEELGPKYEELLNNSYGPGVQKSSWALEELAVIPSARHNARALVQVIRDKARNEGNHLSAETHTELSVIVYERLGFKVVGATDGPIFPNEHGAFAVWALLMD